MTFRLDHLSLPYSRDEPFDPIAQFWRDLDMRIEEYAYSNPEVDHAGAGTRYRIGMGVSHFFLTYHPAYATQEDVIRRTRDFGHLGIEVDPSFLRRMLAHPNRTNVTRWGPGYLSVFVRGPNGLRLEFLARNFLSSDEEQHYGVIHADR